MASVSLVGFQRTGLGAGGRRGATPVRLIDFMVTRLGAPSAPPTDLGTGMPNRNRVGGRATLAAIPTPVLFGHTQIDNGIIGPAMLHSEEISP